MRNHRAGAEGADRLGRGPDADDTICHRDDAGHRGVVDVRRAGVLAAEDQEVGAPGGAGVARVPGDHLQPAVERLRGGVVGANAHRFGGHVSDLCRAVNGRARLHVVDAEPDRALVVVLPPRPNVADVAGSRGTVGHRGALRGAHDGMTADVHRAGTRGRHRLHVAVTVAGVEVRAGTGERGQALLPAALEARQSLGLAEGGGDVCQLVATHQGAALGMHQVDQRLMRRGLQDDVVGLAVDTASERDGDCAGRERH